LPAFIANASHYRTRLAVDAIGGFEVSALQEGERLVLWGLRMIANGRAGCMGLRRAFADTCGTGGEDALIALFTVTRYIGHSAVRPLMVAVPGCPRLSRDERALLDLFGAAEAAVADGAEQALETALDSLVETSAHPAAATMLKAVAGALAAAGAPLRRPGLTAETFVPEGRTLH
jgi:hypothetical protein